MSASTTADNSAQLDTSLTPQKKRMSPRQSNDLFPMKLYELLQSIDSLHLSEAISWLPDGRAFTIGDKQMFTDEVLPKFFRATKLRSFHRQLHLWGFNRITSGPNMGSWYHKSFVRGSPSELEFIIRIGVKSQTPSAVVSIPTSNDAASPSLSTSPKKGDTISTYCFVGRKQCASPPPSSMDDTITLVLDSQNNEGLQDQGILQNTTLSHSHLAESSPICVQTAQEGMFNVLGVTPLPFSSFGRYNDSGNNAEHQMSHPLGRRFIHSNHCATPTFGQGNGPIHHNTASASNGFYLPASIPGNSPSHCAEQMSNPAFCSQCNNSSHYDLNPLPLGGEGSDDEFSAFIEKMIQLV